LGASPLASPVLQREEGDDVLTGESFRAIMSSQQRAGNWEVAEEIEVRAIAGDVSLDFRSAELPPSGLVSIDAFTLCGNIEIIVPDGADVEINGTPILGSIEQQVRKPRARDAIREWVTEDDGQPATHAPNGTSYFRVDCRAILGVIKVTGR
jgi:predicted membrane protein